MKYFVGIDLGTTNSAISTFDGENVRIWKNKKDQTDVTPSAIYTDKRGKKFYGQAAYRKIPQDEKNCAFLFKRFMGTSNKIKMGDKEYTPEECSAEILRELYKNLPEEIRESDEVATVITVPAAFNQMQNAATLEAAKMAGIGKVALMQEPVAAIMCVMRQKKNDSNFLIYDLGGGTLDVAIAENFSGKINFLAHGGQTMCGGRDFDRILTNQIVMPWIMENYSIPRDWNKKEKYKKLFRIATYMAEIAKIELSADEVAHIEGETNIADENGEDIYLDVEISREEYNKLIDEMVMQSIETTRETIEKSGLTPHDIDRIIFIGGPTNYKPLRDKVSAEIGIPGNFDVNPMTAVSEGAAIFAESIDWDSDLHDRKSSTQQVRLEKDLGLTFRYESRTPNKKAKIAAMLKRSVKDFTFEINSVSTGWTSGTVPLENKAIITVPLTKRGENKFIVTAYDNFGKELKLTESEIVITRTLANFSQILANHSIGLEVKESKHNEKTELMYLVRQGDQLPSKGKITLHAGQELKAGSNSSLNFKLWEGEIEEPVTFNRFIGNIKVFGYEFDFGKIIEGAEILCNYSINDAGSIKVEIEIPSIGESFNNDINYYVADDGKLDSAEMLEKLNQDGQEVIYRIRKLGSALDEGEDYEKLRQASEVVSTVITANHSDYDKEQILHLNENLQNVKKTLDTIRKNNLALVQAYEVNHMIEFFNDTVKQFASPADVKDYEKLFAKARSLIGTDEKTAFEDALAQIRYKNYDVLAKDEEFLIYDFERLTKNPNEYLDRDYFERLKLLGNKAIAEENFDALRKILDVLYRLHDISNNDDSAVNIFRV